MFCENLSNYINSIIDIKTPVDLVVS